MPLQTLERKPLDMSELAAKMLEWEQLTRQAYELAAEIEAAVLGIGKTQTVGNVRATYSAGRKSYDYRLAALDNIDDIDAANKEFSKTAVDYRAMCNAYEIKDIPFTQGAPSVSVKLLD